MAIEGETRPELAELVDDIVWIRVGQLSKMISAFVRRGIKQCVMAGQVALGDVETDELQKSE